MKKVYLAVIVLFLNIFPFFGQDNSYNWNLRWRVSCDSSSVWTIDNLNQLIIQSSGSIKKYNPKGIQYAEQSIKQTGSFSQLDGGNGLKIAGFSNEQQQVCFFDNTLSLQNKCIDLSEFQISTAQFFCLSEQTDKFWIYDEMKSELALLTLNTNQQQKVPNLRNLSAIQEIIGMKELNNQLYLIDRKHILVFDLFGSFIKDIELDLSGAKSIQITDQHIFILNTDGQNVAYHLDEMNTSKIDFPLSECTDFSVKNGLYYFQKGSEIYCYEINIKN